MYRAIVIGRGLIGSAAGRHLSRTVEGVALLGPDEPKDRATHHGVFGSHYDEGRMTRVVDPVPAWAITAQRSIDRYAEIEAESGISFFTNSGYLGLGKSGADYLRRSEVVGRGLKADVHRLSPPEVRRRFPFLTIAADAEGLYEGDRAGHVSPRAMVRAQTEAARKRGADIVSAEATAVRTVTGGVEVETSSGDTLRAERVLIATGAFTELCGLSPTDLKLRVFGRTVVLVRIDDDFPEDLSGMPTMVHVETGAYILPPIRYPDGKVYLKIGIGTTDDLEPESLADLQHWFKGPGSDDNRREFRQFLVDLIPSLAHCSAWHSDSCAVTWTASGLPTIDYLVDNRIAVAVGGNGKGAKSADDWGWIAARMIAGQEWDHPLDPSLVKLSAGP